jgi:hypothetical protein
MARSQPSKHESPIATLNTQIKFNQFSFKKTRPTRTSKNSYTVIKNMATKPLAIMQCQISKPYTRTTSGCTTLSLKNLADE